MEKFTLHIFAYGETQIISKELNVKVKTSELTKAEPLIDAVWSEKPEDVGGNKDDFSNITFFDFTKIAWAEETFIIKEEDSTVKELINDLIAELETKK